MPIEYLSHAMCRIASPQQDHEQLGSGYGGVRGPAECPLWFQANDTVRGRLAGILSLSRQPIVLQKRFGLGESLTYFDKLRMPLTGAQTGRQDCRSEQNRSGRVPGQTTDD